MSVRIKKPKDMSSVEAARYVQYLEDKYHRRLESLIIEADENDPDYVGLTYRFSAVPFDRIRRITGYLVGTMDHWNDAKASEEADRVKHGMQELPF